MHAREHQAKWRGAPRAGQRADLTAEGHERDALHRANEAQEDPPHHRRRGH